jgi:hypothetical protein
MAAGGAAANETLHEISEIEKERKYRAGIKGGTYTRWVEYIEPGRRRKY